MDNAFEKLDDLAAKYCQRGKNNYEKLSDDDATDLLIAFLQATDSKSLPSLDAIDPNKYLIDAVLNYLLKGNQNELNRIVELLRNGLLEIYKVRINHLLAEKQKEYAKADSNL